MRISARGFAISQVFNQKLLIMNYIYKLKFNTIINKEDDRDITQEFITDLFSKFDIKTIVHIGIIIKPATFDEEGNELTHATVVEGYHVDVNAFELIEELRAYCLDHAPVSPTHGDGWASRPYVLVLQAGEEVVE